MDIKDQVSNVLKNTVQPEFAKFMETLLLKTVGEFYWNEYIRKPFDHGNIKWQAHWNNLKDLDISALCRVALCNKELFCNDNDKDFGNLYDVRNRIFQLRDLRNKSEHNTADNVNEINDDDLYDLVSFLKIIRASDESKDKIKQIIKEIKPSKFIIDKAVPITIPNPTSIKDKYTNVYEIIKRPLPENLNVVSGSVPVPFFGDVNTAKAATISLNPSNNEFCVADSTELLPMSEKRFVDRECLRILDSDSLSDKQANEVFNSYCEYFHKKPYMRWFSKLESFIQDVSDGHFSYMEGTMIHLDIAPYATNPTWSNLPEIVKRGLFQPYHSIGLKIIEDAGLKYLFINGKTTKENFEKYFNINLNLEKSFKAKTRECNIWIGKYKECKIIAWNLDVPNGAPNEQKYAVKEIFEKLDKVA